MSRRYWLILGAVVAVVVVIWLASSSDPQRAWTRITREAESSTTPAYECDGDGFMCPDGTVVGRTGPRCEFAPCPSGNATSAALSTTLGQKVSGLNVSITPLEVVEDSRCPANANCVWAGTLKVRTKIESGMGESEMTLELGKPITTEAEEITLSDVAPAAVAGQTIPSSSYQFTFTVEKRSSMTLFSKKWTWVSAQYNDGRVIEPKKAGAFVLTFEGDGRFSAKTDCNSMGGSYSATNSAISFSDSFMTKMFCEGSQEMEFASLLENASDYHFSPKGELILELKDNGTAMFK